MRPDSKPRVVRCWWGLDGAGFCMVLWFDSAGRMRHDNICVPAHAVQKALTGKNDLFVIELRQQLQKIGALQ